MIIKESLPCLLQISNRSFTHIIIISATLSYNLSITSMAAKKEVWISNNTNPKFIQIKSTFVELMQEQSKESKINYYDFLLVAKKLSFRFEESSHLMAIKNYFSKSKNSVSVKKIADTLCVSQESIHLQEEKIIVKFNVPDFEFSVIKEETHEDDEGNSQNGSDGDAEDEFEKMGEHGMADEHEKEINEKIAIILSIKVDEMDKKLQMLLNVKDGQSIFSTLAPTHTEEYLKRIDYEAFKKAILSSIVPIRDKIRLSEDDVKTIFFILDADKDESITLDKLEKLKNIDEMLDQMRIFYKSRINKEMVKNTLFKLGRVKNNSIQIYQVKNASLLEFENIERSMIDADEKHFKLKANKFPHFGPLKGAMMASKVKDSHDAYKSIQQFKGNGQQLKLERDKIEKILRLSKEEKRRSKNGDTVASKLRSLFIHKVILPREKMLEQEKERYMKIKVNDSGDLFVRANR